MLSWAHLHISSVIAESAFIFLLVLINGGPIDTPVFILIQECIDLHDIVGVGGH
ncbi:hypothetical protein P368_17180 [Comamonas thiooxydans]|nr:hypothetical protein P369_14610 [Comamonas thiooxydans]KGG97222.1 hypothetical protein P367_16790 [Comamonas thiooxydans]KGH00409.1 hypothetical protein P365_20995 [Comamonas thiooxydans]KGH09858.1 hypothetical protein P368_17180 [Comamonas thiooxydans]